MNDEQRFQLRFGPYKPPHFEYGATRVEPYRTTLCRDESKHPWVNSGQAWLEQQRVSARR